MNLTKTIRKLPINEDGQRAGYYIHDDLSNAAIQYDDAKVILSLQSLSMETFFLPVSPLLSNLLHPCGGFDASRVRRAIDTAFVCLQSDMIPGDITKPLAHDSFKSTLEAYSIGVQKQPRLGIDTLHMCPALHTSLRMCF